MLLPTATNHCYIHSIFYTGIESHMICDSFNQSGNIQGTEYGMGGYGWLVFVVAHVHKSSERLLAPPAIG